MDMKSLNDFHRIEDAINTVCSYCEVDECERCIVTNLHDDLLCEAEHKGFIDEASGQLVSED